MKWTIGKRITLTFFIVLAITAAMGVIAIMQFKSVGNEVDFTAERAVPASTAAAKLESVSRHTFVLTAQHLQAPDVQTRAAIEKEFQDVGKDLQGAVDDLDKYVKSPEGRRYFDAINTPRQDFRKHRAEVLRLSNEGKLDDARLVMRTQMQPAYYAYMKAVGDLADYERKLGVDSATEAKKCVIAGITGVWISLSIALSLGVVIAWISIRAINKALHCIATSLGEGAAQVETAAGQVSGSSQSIAQGASEQAAALEETTSALTEMSTMTHQNAELAQQAATLSGEAKNVSDRGNQAMARMSSAITDIQKSAAETAKIVKVIDEIAFQTNLLALNAAVEAARAGEAGKGFAVVAEEVRNLAQRSAEAAKNTTSLIEESVKNAQNGVNIAGEVGKDLGEITDKSTRVNSLITQIADASKEQARGIEQVSTAATQMDQVTQSNAANAEESASASEELSGQARALNQMVGDLMMLINGKNTLQSSSAGMISVAPQTRKAPVASAKSAKSADKKASAQPVKESSESFAEFTAA